MKPPGVKADKTVDKRHSLHLSAAALITPPPRFLQFIIKFSSCICLNKRLCKRNLRIKETHARFEMPAPQLHYRPARQTESRPTTDVRRGESHAGARESDVTSPVASFDTL